MQKTGLIKEKTEMDYIEETIKKFDTAIKSLSKQFSNMLESANQLNLPTVEKEQLIIYVEEFYDLKNDTLNFGKDLELMNPHDRSVAIKLRRSSDQNTRQRMIYLDRAIKLAFSSSQARTNENKKNSQSVNEL